MWVTRISKSTHVDADQISDGGAACPADGEDARETIRAIGRCLEYLRDSAEEHQLVNLAYLIELAVIEARRAGAGAACPRE
jgi:hypothetical protein